MIRTLPAFLFMILVAACGSDSDPETDASAAPTTTTTTSAAPELAACETVWVDGQTLPADYAGCKGGASDTVGEVGTCISGTDKYATYVRNQDDIERPFFGLLGGKVIEYTDDEFGPYAKAFGECVP